MKRATGVFLLVCAWGTFAQAVSIGEAVNQPAWTWSTGGHQSWTGQTAVSHDGVSSAQSGAITHSQTSWVETVISGPGTLTFWWRTSSELDWDKLDFYLNGRQAARITGESGWQQKRIPIPSGVSTMKWAYIKDSMISEGDDAAWLDEVQLTNGFFWTQCPHHTGEGTTLDLAVWRAGSLSGTVSVDYFTSNGTASAGVDYVGQTGVLTFSSGVATQYIHISTLAPGAQAGVKTFGVGLRNPTPGWLSDTNVTIHIFDRPPEIVDVYWDETVYYGDRAWMGVSVAFFGDVFSGTDCDWFRGNPGNTNDWIARKVFSQWGSASLYTDPFSGSTTYWIRVNNPVGSTNGPAMTVTVLPQIVPVIDTQPSDETIYAGDTTSLSIDAHGGGLSFQWYSGTAGNTTHPIEASWSSELSSGYSTPPLFAGTSYWVLISNATGSTTSRTATITVQPDVIPMITGYAVTNFGILYGDDVWMQLNATGGDLTFHWYRGPKGDTHDPVYTTRGGDWSGYDSPPLYSSTSYWVLVTNTAGSTMSEPFVVTVISLHSPIIQTEPSDQQIDGGEETTLWCQAAGGNLNFRWYRGLSGDTNHFLGVYFYAEYSAWDNYDTPFLYSNTCYWVLVTNELGAITSRTATITVQPPGFPGFIEEPLGGTIYEGDIWTMWASATGGMLTLVYFEGDAGITNNPVRTVTGGSTLYTSHTTPQLYTGTSFWVRVGNPVGVITSQAAVINVLPMETPGITGGPFDFRFDPGSGGYTFLYAQGGSLLYQWFQGEAGDRHLPLITTSNESSSTLDIDPLAISTCYWVLVSNPMGTITSRTCWVRGNGLVNPYDVSLSRITNGICLACPTEPLANYRLEYSYDLAEWQEEGLYDTGDGNPLLLNRSSVGSNACYYRIEAW